MIDVPAGARLCLWSSALLTACGAAGARDCAPFSVAPVAGVERSRWHESGADGAGLVSEEGNLRKLGLEAILECGRSEWGLRWSRSEGRRDYEGVTNTRVPVETVTAVRDDALSLTAMRAIDEGIALGVTAEHRNVRRSIESTAFARGYPERFRYWSVAAGGRYTRMLSGPLFVAFSGWIGAGPGGRLRVDLPVADPAELRLGASRSVELAVQLANRRPRSDALGWSWSVGLSYRAEVIGAGDAQTVYRGAVPVGSASQPRTTQTRAGFFARAALTF